MNDFSIMGNMGCYIEDGNIISFQMGDEPSFGMEETRRFAPIYNSIPELQWLCVDGFNIASRGANNMKCEEIEHDIKKNRLMPQLIRKQVKMLYGNGPAVYKPVMKEGKFVKEWVECPEIQEWLESWEDAGLESNYKEVAKTNITNYYYYRDYFVKWRMNLGNSINKQRPVIGLEAMENKHCRLATRIRDVLTTMVNYKDFSHISVGRWNYGISSYLFYPRFRVKDIRNYKYAAISHHREKSVGEYYGVNETHEGSKPYIKGSNETAGYINSFLKNSLAAKIHIIIPNAWLEAKKQQIRNLCDENKRREAKKLELLKYNGIEIGTEYSETLIIRYTQQELRTISRMLTGADNQGKAYATISFKSGNSEEERWRFETIDMKYKEYIEALIDYDKRADEALLSAVGLDPSISSVSKDGVISKSGADVYYNYLIYLMSLTPDDEVCAEPFNMAIQVNFPELYKQGYRIGFYRDVPSRQEEVTPQERLNQQQS